MIIAVIVIFLAGYLVIALETPLRLNKAASALLTGGICWLLFFLHAGSADQATEVLMHHLAEISSILFFLLGAMTIVEIIDTYDGFNIITSKIKTTSKRRLLLYVTIITFFLSAFLDNLTTAIVMASLTRKLLTEKEDKLWFAGMIVIAANAGGAWSPLGDVTTTMLWIGGQISAINIILKVFLPGLAVCVIPFLIVYKRFKKSVVVRKETETTGLKTGIIVLIAGILMLLFVPVFKMATHMPPFMGMLLALSLMWVLTSVIQISNKEEKIDTVSASLRKIDTPSILFFLGILLAVSALSSFGVLGQLAAGLSKAFPNHYTVAIVLGMVSAVVDNVPLVAAAQGMYSLHQYPTDHSFWEFLALTSGTGGSAIIIGSAAGVAIMGIENISFIWYLKKITWLALIGFIAGILVFLAQEFFFR
jgi:Na+/H+ antiporter NhaD/arsenite permease-like protein